MNCNSVKYYHLILACAITAFFSFSQLGRIEAQCAFVGPVSVQPGQTQSFSLDVAGAVNNDLASTSQGICAVFLEFSHNLIGEMEVNLISPAGTVVKLVGSVTPSNPSNLTRWNVSFVPCGEIASPDNGFSPIWSNDQPWGILGNFAGSYYPNTGCLEDFNFGPVNGFWQIEIINSSLFNVATLRSFAILFCDPTGLDCFICLSKGGSLDLADSTYCLNDPGLLLDIDLTYVGFRPDPNDYHYVYLLTQNGIITDTLGVPDLRGYHAGQYEICGLSYLQVDESEIVDQILGESIEELKDTLNSLSPPFCASLSSNCIPITILSGNDTTLIVQHICEGDTVFIDGIGFSETGNYSVDALDVNGCDSVVSLDLRKYILSGIAISVPDLSCNNSTVQLGLIQLITNFLPAELTYIWLDEFFNPIIQSEFLQIDSAGMYYLIVQGESSLIICRDTFSFQVNDTRIVHAPQVTISGNLCFGNTFEALIENPISGGNYVWTVLNGNGNITVKNDNAAADILVENGTDVEVCVELADPCYVTERVCVTLQLLPVPQLNLPLDTVVCGTSVVFAFPALPGTGRFAFVSGPDPTFVIDEISPELFGILVAEPGTYLFEFELLINSCSFVYPVNITFNPDPFVTINALTSELCDGDSVRLHVELPVPGTYTVNISIPGIGPTPFSGLSNDTILSLEVQGMVFTIGVLSVFPDGNADCIVFLNDQIPFIRFDEPDLSLIPDASVCNQQLTGGFETYVDFEDLSSGINGSLSFVNIDNIGSGSFPIINFENVPPGRYAFLVLADYSNGACPQAEDTIIVNVVDCSCDDYTVLNDTVEVCGLDIVNLNIYKNHTNGGSWQLTSGPDGHSMILQGAVSANFQSQPSGLYEFVFSLNDPKPFCNFQDTLYIESTRVFSGGTFLKDSIRICVDLDSVVQFTSWLTGNDPGGKWVYTGGLDIPSNALDSINGELTIQNFAAGTYSFQYQPQADILCFLPVQTIYIIIEENINAQLPDNLSLNCEVSSLNIGILPSNSAEYSFQWTTIGGNIEQGEENIAIINVRSEGLYILHMKNNNNHCTLTDSVMVSKSEESIDSVDYIIQGPQCLELNTGSITIMNVFGGNSPFIFKVGAQQGDSTGVIRGLRSGAYALEVIDADGCRWVDTIQIPALVPGFVDIGPDRSGTPSDIFNLEFSTDLTEDEVDYWIWEIPDFDICNSCDVWSISTPKTVPVLMTLFTTAGCILRDTMWIYIDENFQFFFPGAFSPNSDGINDRILIYTHDESIRVEHFEIFDRWGNQVFYAANYLPATELIGWDGIFEGREALPAVYVYKILLSRSSQPAVFFTGEFLLVR